MEMDNLENIVITNVYPPKMVHLIKGRTHHRECRPYFGLSFCTKGQIRYTMNGKTYILHQNNAILLPKGGTYSLFVEKEGLSPMVNFDCYGLSCGEIMVFPLQDPLACIRKIEAIQNEFMFHNNRLQVYSLFYDLLNRLFFADSAEHTHLFSILRYIEENISKPELSNTGMARHLGISEVYFRKLFITYYNITPKQYVMNLRIRKAKQMLTDTPFTVTAIADACGFSSVYQFCRAFKARTGLTPTQYAAENRIFKI